MPSGVYYDINFRLLVYRNHINFQHDPNWIITHCFAGNPIYEDISPDYLRKLCANLHNPDFAEIYLLGPKTYNKVGRPQKLDVFEKTLIMDIINFLLMVHISVSGYFQMVIINTIYF